LSLVIRGAGLYDARRVDAPLARQRTLHCLYGS
jgi:hypothetical protein